jgi:hypothetical protein
MPKDFSSISPTLAGRHIFIKLPSGAVKNLFKHVDTAGWSAKLLDGFHQPVLCCMDLKKFCSISAYHEFWSCTCSLKISNIVRQESKKVWLLVKWCNKWLPNLILFTMFIIIVVISSTLYSRILWNNYFLRPSLSPPSC